MLFIQTLWTDPVYFCMVCLIVTFSICLHEYFHALAGVREGDYTLESRLTLNPMRQMGFRALLMMMFFGIAWGMTPVNRQLLRRGRRSDLKVSLAGPFANLLLFLLGSVLLGLGSRISGLGPQEKAMLLQFFALFGIYNFVLMAFNMIPLPGMDGWHVLAALFPKLNNVSSEAAKGVMLFLLLAAFFTIGLLYNAGYVCVKAVAVLFGGR